MKLQRYLSSAPGRLLPWLALPVAAVAAYQLGSIAHPQKPAGTAPAAMETAMDRDDTAAPGHMHHQGVRARREYGPQDSLEQQLSNHGRAADAEIWTCAMHPRIRRSEPGDCPICGMALIPLNNPADNPTTEDDAAGRVTLSERARIKARIRTVPVTRLATGQVERRLLGHVDYDETALRTVTTWIGGRIDRLHVRVTGQRVTKGQVIATLYSPEVYSAGQDRLQAQKQLDRLDAKATPTAQAAARAALAAAHDRLRLLGLPESELDNPPPGGKPFEQVRIRTPFGGTVIERLATEGDYVSTGNGLYRVADLSRLWVQLDAYESDLPLLSEGQEVSLEMLALPGETFQGRVTFVAPVLDDRTRTALVRIEVLNRAGRLRPGMFAAAVVHASIAGAGDLPLAIPETAPLFTGRRSVVYVEVPGTEFPVYQARTVRLGPKSGTSYSVLEGLREGERVVTHGAFTLDADLQIRGGASMMAQPDTLEDTPSGSPSPAAAPGNTPP